MSLKIRLPIDNLLTFYDAPKAEHRGHVSAITGMIGEDIGAGLLLHYWESIGHDVEIIDGSVNQGTNRGNRLDRWIRVKEGHEWIFYQVEIKNWAASAIGGRRIDIDAEPTLLSEHKIERWSKEWSGRGFIKKAVAKVLTRMRVPVEGATVRPLACYWDAMHPTGADEPLFSMETFSKDFNRVWIFSMSAYLRVLKNQGRDDVVIYAPSVVARMKLLAELIG